MSFLSSLIARQQPLPWRKTGLVYEPAADGFSHGSQPCAVHIEGDRYIIAFTRRDASQRSHIFLSEAVVADGSVTLLGEPKLAVEPGEPCHFDCDGTISVCFVKHRGAIHLYYVGWMNLPERRWKCDTGRLTLDPSTLSLTRDFLGPVLGQDRSNPLFAAATAFHVEGDTWQTWYNSCLRWEKTADGWKHHYGVHYAHSRDGIDWICEPGMCLPFVDEYEYAFGRPCVLRREGTYFMWYSHRATRTTDTYRMGFSASTDGRTWRRNDHLAGIDVSPSGWDSEMICYPCVFEHGGLFYMLYNGNGYGATGFGLAVMEGA